MPTTVYSGTLCCPVSKCIWTADMENQQEALVLNALRNSGREELAAHLQRAHGYDPAQSVRAASLVQPSVTSELEPVYRG